MTDRKRQKKISTPSIHDIKTDDPVTKSEPINTSQENTEAMMDIEKQNNTVAHEAPDHVLNVRVFRTQRHPFNSTTIQTCRVMKYVQDNVIETLLEAVPNMINNNTNTYILCANSMLSNLFNETIIQDYIDPVISKICDHEPGEPRYKEIQQKMLEANYWPPCFQEGVSRKNFIKDLEESDARVKRFQLHKSSWELLTGT